MEERRQIAEQMRILQRNEELGTLIAGLAHNFNNLLTGIAGPLQIVQRNASLDDDARHWLQVAEHATEQVTRLVHQMQTLTRPSTTAVETVDVAAIASDMVGLISGATGHEVEFSLDVTTSLPAVRAERSAVGQILMNLLTNSRDAVIERRRRDGAAFAGCVRVVVGADRVTGTVSVTIEDNGPGIPDNLRKRVFEPFFTTKSPGTGTGLGLSTVATLVRRFDGSITVAPAPGGGCVFTVNLPAASDASDPAPVTLADGALPLAGLSVLVVEDDEAARAFAKHVLLRSGAGVESAEDGASGLRALASAVPDVVLFDLNMPGMTGWQFLQRARLLAPHARFVVVAGYVNEGMQDLYRPQAVVRKPYRVDDLLDAVRPEAPHSEISPGNPRATW
ncbi:MAG: ATP-binding protein [Dehalococcoidia bacterium]